MSKHELIERDLKRVSWQETLDSVKRIQAGEVGNINTVKLPAALEARRKFGLPQSKFVELMASESIGCSLFNRKWLWSNLTKECLRLLASSGQFSVRIKK